jgi:uncharacterized membrane protein YkoI
MKRFRTILITMAAAATLSLSATSSYAAVLGKNAACLTDQQIQAAIQSGQIKSWPTIKKMAHISSDYQEVSDVRVCRIDGVLYYTVNLVSSYGDAKKIVVNAVDGSG